MIEDELHVNCEITQPPCGIPGAPSPSLLILSLEYIHDGKQILNNIQIQKAL